MEGLSAETERKSAHIFVNVWTISDFGKTGLTCFPKMRLHDTLILTEDCGRRSFFANFSHGDLV